MGEKQAQIDTIAAEDPVFASRFGGTLGPLTAGEGQAILARVFPQIAGMAMGALRLIAGWAVSQ